MPERLNLKEYISSKEKKQTYVNRLFETIAPRYDFITVFLSYGMDRGWKRRLVDMAKLGGDETALDLACGTGDITFALSERLPRGQAIGLDITESMLLIAERKRSERNIANVAFHRADIMSMPFEAESFDCVTCGYALRNVPDVARALEEIKRVLRPGGSFLSLDFAHPGNKIYRWLYLRYLATVGSTLGLILHGDPDTYRYIPESLRSYPGSRAVGQMLKRRGFDRLAIVPVLGGFLAMHVANKRNDGNR